MQLHIDFSSRDIYSHFFHAAFAGCAYTRNRVETMVGVVDPLRAPPVLRFDEPPGMAFGHAVAASSRQRGCVGLGLDAECGVEDGGADEGERGDVWRVPRRLEERVGDGVENCGEVEPGREGFGEGEELVDRREVLRDCLGGVGERRVQRVIKLVDEGFSRVLENLFPNLILLDQVDASRESRPERKGRVLVVVRAPLARTAHPIEEHRGPRNRAPMPRGRRVDARTKGCAL